MDEVKTIILKRIKTTNYQPVYRVNFKEEIHTSVPSSYFGYNFSKANTKYIDRLEINSLMIALKQISKETNKNLNNGMVDFEVFASTCYVKDIYEEFKQIKGNVFNSDRTVVVIDGDKYNIEEIAYNVDRNVYEVKLDKKFCESKITNNKSDIDLVGLKEELYLAFNEFRKTLNKEV